jgi:hypothetical protein
MLIVNFYNQNAMSDALGKAKKPLVAREAARALS